MRWILHFLFGWFCISCPCAERENILNLLLENKLNSWGFSSADDVFSLSVDRRGLDCVLASFAEKVRVTPHGLPVYVRALCKRPGLILGALVACLTVCFAGSILWDVRIEGNQKLEDAVIEEALASAGLAVGVRCAEIDRRTLVANVLENFDGLSYLAVNIKGNVAYVNVMENAKAPATPPRKGGANLVAARDAVIDSLSVVRGEVCVRAGDVVQKGDLLVSGVTDAYGGSSFVYATGEVFGCVEEEFSVFVGFKSEKSTPESEKTVGFSLNFFGKCINIFGGGGNSPSTYGTIYCKEEFTLPGGIRLPFGYVRTVAKTYRTETEILTDKQAVLLATDKANEQLRTELQNAELLTRHLSGSFSEEGYTLVCTYVCVKNIAETVEFPVNDR